VVRDGTGDGLITSMNAELSGRTRKISDEIGEMFLKNIFGAEARSGLFGGLMS